MTQQRQIQGGHWGCVPRGSKDYIAKQKLRKLRLPDILLQDNFRDSSVDRMSVMNRTNLGSWVYTSSNITRQLTTVLQANHRVSINYNLYYLDTCTL